MCWLIAGFSIAAAVALAVIVCMQRTYSQLQQEELIALRDLLRNVGEVIHRQEAVNRELTSGLRAEKAHVAQIKRQYELGGLGSTFTGAE